MNAIGFTQAQLDGQALADLKISLVSAINVALDGKLYRGFVYSDGNGYRADQKAREVVMEAYLGMIAQQPTFPLRIRDVANQDHLFDEATFPTFAIAFKTWVGAVYMAYHSDKDAIREALTVEEAQAIFDSGNWEAT